MAPIFEHRIDIPMLSVSILYTIEMWLKANVIYYRISTDTSGDVWLDTFRFTSKGDLALFKLTWDDDIRI